MKEKPLILVTNDDGYNAPGLAALVEVLRPLGRLIVVAPEKAQSGMSHAVTMSHPLYLKTVVQEEGLAIHSFSGTPADCIKFGIDYMLEERPALIVSGINHGSNSAINVIYSGTMGGAIEGSLYNIPAIGLSLLDHSESADLEASKHFAGIIVRRTLGQIAAGCIHDYFCMNVNIPALPVDQIRGIKVCRQAKGYWEEGFVKRIDPRGRTYYWLSGHFNNLEPEATDTDEWALANGYVSMVPIQVDLTHYARLDDIRYMEILE